ncbi:MAG: lamin tail domain-containing protein, partial [Planctomycetes bacterium]|nr:lamin tail domain-containing protein [Planctomycetota bacterium]
MNDHKQPWFGLFLCAILAFATPSSHGLVVSELMYHPAGEGELLEFIELYNDRATTEDMSEYAFIRGIQYLFPVGTKISPKSYLIVARDPNALAAAYGLTDVLGPYTGTLSNGGERIELATSSGGAFLALRYEDTMPWPVSPDGTGHSLVLARLGGDPDQGSTWSASTRLGGTPGEPDQVQSEPEDPTHVTLVEVGHAGRYFEGTEEPAPGSNGKATTAWTQLGFNDDPASTAWQDGPSGYGYSNNAGELQYVGTPLNMTGRYISVYARLAFTLTVQEIRAFSDMQARVRYDDGYVLYLNGVRVAGSMNSNPPAFDQSGGSASDGLEADVDLTGHIDLLVPGTNVLAIQGHNATLSGSSDCLCSPSLFATIVPEVDAGVDPGARVVINELLANSQADPSLDWIELYNPGPDAVNLSHVYLSDDPVDLLQYRIADGTVLAPGAFWSVTQGAQLGGLPFALSDRGETLYVTAATDEAVPQPIRVMDAVRFGNMAPDVTFGRFPDGAQDFDMLAEPTEGASNALPAIGDIVINEIMYHHGLRDDRYEYVELHNRSTRTVSLEGWAFTDGIDYEFDPMLDMLPGAYLVVARDPNLLAETYGHLVKGLNLVGPYAGSLNHH